MDRTLLNKHTKFGGKKITEYPHFMILGVGSFFKLHPVYKNRVSFYGDSSFMFQTWTLSVV